MVDRSSISVDWDGEVFKPASPFWAKEADKHYVIGERYVLSEQKQRSDASHNFYFATLTEAWRNLREDEAQLYPTVDHLRAHALIKSGHCTERRVVASNNSEALMLSGMVHQWSPYALVTVIGNVVTIWEAKSQSKKAMGKDAFEKSKNDVLDIAAGMIGVTSADLARQR